MTKEAEMKKRILDEAYRRGYDYMPKHSWPCAPAVFAAVMDTLGYEDDPVINDVWKATIGFTGGTGNMAIGTCGAMDGAAAAISYSFGFAKEDTDFMKMLKVIERARYTVKYNARRSSSITGESPTDSPIRRL